MSQSKAASPAGVWHYFSTPSTFDQAFPTVTDFTIEIEEDDSIWPVKDGKSRFTFADRETMRPVLACSNRGCHEGGLSIQRIFEKLIATGQAKMEDRQRCPGYEGSPGGRKRIRDCNHSFKVSVTVSLGPAEQR